MSQTRGTNLYKNTKITDFYLDIWSPIFVREGVLDASMVITAKYDRRPDLLSFDVYGTPKFWWVFMMRNKDIIFDPINDFVPGVEIRIPSLSNVSGA